MARQRLFHPVDPELLELRKGLHRGLERVGFGQIKLQADPWATGLPDRTHGRDVSAPTRRMSAFDFYLPAALPDSLQSKLGRRPRLHETDPESGPFDIDART